tara:strand:+ start:207 stop:413 length:207 start_codon:yes stop_codon:yes gene_type:complete
MLRNLMLFLILLTLTLILSKMPTQFPISSVSETLSGETVKTYPIEIEYLSSLSGETVKTYPIEIEYLN